jgi:type II secretory ATPase GspE/PulE/Tfp pilus assembly ATPase PilB-like protein
MGIYELLMIDDHMRDLIVQRKSAGEMVRVARDKGLKLMREDGWTKVRKGVTTVEEVLRVTKLDARAQ